MKKFNKVIINVTLVLISAVAFAGPDHLRTPDAYDNAVWTEYGQRFVAEEDAMFGVSFYMKNNNGAPGPFEIAVYELPDSENPIKLHEFSSDGSGLDGLVEVSFDSHVLTTVGSNYLFTIKRSTTDTYDIGLYSLSDSYLDGDTAVRLNDGTMAFNESKRDLSFSINSGEGDSDGDGLSDGDEVNTYGTDPNDSDTDDDGVSDGDEVANGTDPLISNLPNLTLQFKNIKSSFFNGNVSIGNAIGIGCRVELLWSSLDAASTGLGDETNLISTVTGAGASDAYGFGFWSSSSITLDDLPEESGYVWVRVYNKSETYYIDLGELDISSTTASLDKDTVLRIPDSSRINRSYVMERDGINNPLADNDEDGLNNRYEIENGLDPNDADSDNDGLTDGDEVLVHNSNPLSEDTDNDGIEDGLEASHTTFGLDININSSNVVDFIQDMNRMKPEWRGEGMTLDESKTELVKLRPGSKAVDVSNGTARIRMKLEQSSDLMSNWTNRVDTMEVDLPASKDVLFYRIRTD